MNENLKIAKEMIAIAKEIMSDNFSNDISNQFKSLSREINKPNNTKNVSKGLNNLSKSFKKMPKPAKASEMNNDDIVAEITKIAQELLKDQEQ